MAHSTLGNLKKEPTIIGFFFTFNHKWKVINQAIKESSSEAEAFNTARISPVP